MPNIIDDLIRDLRRDEAIVTATKLALKNALLAESAFGIGDTVTIKNWSGCTHTVKVTSAFLETDTLNPYISFTGLPLNKDGSVSASMPPLFNKEHVISVQGKEDTNA